MKKLYLLLIALILIPRVALAEEKPKVLTLVAEADGSTISYNGTTEDKSYAVMCKLYNSSDETVDQLSVSVDSNKFTGSFKVSKVGDYKVACANYEGGEIKQASVNVSEDGTEKYTISDEAGNSISFTEDKDKEFHLFITDYLSLSKEDLKNANVSEEEYNTVLKALKDGTKKHGTLIAFYEIEVKDKNDALVEEGPFIIKIKMTDEMKKYNTFKLINVDMSDDGKLSFEDPISLTVEGDYLTGTLKHLSKYALTGSVEKTNADGSPKTYDSIYVWMGVLLVSIVGVTATVIAIKKSKKRV